MHELTAPHLDRLRRLVPSHRSAGHMATVHAVIDGLQPGNVFVDDLRSPRSALVFNQSFGFALGEARPELAAPMLALLLAQPWMSAQATALWCTAPAWGPALRPFFREERSRDEFHFEPTRVPVAPRLPEGYRLQPLDEDLATRLGNGLDAWVVRTWGGPARLVKLGFGMIVLCGETLVTSCTACALCGHPGEVEAEIAIATDPAHRQKGLALAAAVAFFEQCRERAVTPAWTCDSRNLPSQRAAVRLGFQEFRKIVGFRMRPDALA